MSTLDSDIKSLRIACKRFAIILLKSMSRVLDETADRIVMCDGGTTKVCICGNTHLVLLHTENRKICMDCGNEVKWYLEPGQKPLV